jgi:hypothetical protein
MLALMESQIAVYELMCTFFLDCHIVNLASETWLGQPSWLKNIGQFSQKKVWLFVGIIGEFVGVNTAPHELSQRPLDENISNFSFQLA